MNQPFIINEHEKGEPYIGRFERTAELKMISFVWLTAAIVLMLVAVCIFLWLGGCARKTHLEENLAVDKSYALQSNIFIDSDEWEGSLLKKRGSMYLLFKKRRPLGLLVAHVFVFEQQKQQNQRELFVKQTN